MEVLLPLPPRLRVHLGVVEQTLQLCRELLEPAFVMPSRRPVDARPAMLVVDVPVRGDGVLQLFPK
jgi:hypothetical protein